MVFGSAKSNDPNLRPVFNKIDIPYQELYVLLPSVELNWPEGKILTQVLVIVAGTKDNVAQRASQIEKTIPVATLH